jgi:hypothetical protein
MTTVETDGAGFNDRGEARLAEATSPVTPGGAGLVLPEEVVADLAGQLVVRARAGEPVALTGRDGLLSGLIGQVLQAGLALELEDHLAGGDGNGRNGFRAKTLSTEAGPVTVSVPRDRAGTFEPALIPKGARRTAGISDTVISLYAGGMSVRDVARHCQRTMGIEISRDTISKITDEVLEEMRAWQVRPLEAVYPIVYVDALVAKVRDGGAVRNKAVNIAVGMDCEGVKHVLGIWVAAAEGRRGLRRSRRCATVAWLTSSSAAVTGWAGWARRSPRPGRRRPCRPARCTSSGPRPGSRPTVTARACARRCGRSTPRSTSTRPRPRCWSSPTRR